HSHARSACVFLHAGDQNQRSPKFSGCPPARRLLELESCTHTIIPTPAGLNLLTKLRSLPPRERSTPRVQLLLELLLHALARDHGYPLPRTVPRKTLFNLSLHPRRSNIRTPSIHERHYLDKRNIDARVHILPQPPPSQLYRNFVRTPLAIHCIGRRRRRPALRSSSECQLNRGLE